MTDAAYLDQTLSTHERVADLIGRMTLAEKVGQMLQLDAKNGVDEYVLEYNVGSLLHASPENLARAHALVQQTRLRIPLAHWRRLHSRPLILRRRDDLPHPTGHGCLLRSRDLLEAVARATAVEVAPTGIHWTFSPVLCIARDLRWGRVDETFGEDPHLIGELAAAMVRGYQGDGLGDPDAILATAKHFAGYSETQGGRDASEADISQRKLRSWYLPPFERVAREGVASFMLGYQSTDGIPITINKWLLNDVLRGEWGYQGTLVTDWDNVGNLVREQRLFPDYAQAAAAAVNAGNDMIMTTPAFFEGAQYAVAQGLLDEAHIDAAVARILTLKFELGLFENPRVPDLARQASSHRQRRAHRAQPRRRSPLARAAAQRRHVAACSARRSQACGRWPQRGRRAVPTGRLGRQLRARRTGCRTATGASRSRRSSTASVPSLGQALR